MKKIKVILYQKPLGISITHADVDEMRSFEPHFICFPEYFFVNRSLGNQDQTPHNQKRQLQRLEMLSKKLKTVIIGGTMPELDNGRVYNTCFVFQDGKMLGSYRKKNLFFAEEDKITPGDSYKVFSAYGISFGILICADVFHDASFNFMKENKAAIIFSPTFSLVKQEPVEEKFKRDVDIYVRGAAISDSIIVKVCGVKSEYIPFLQARSLIADNEKVIFRVNPDDENSAMIIKQEIVLRI